MPEPTSGTQLRVLQILQPVIVDHDPAADKSHLFQQADHAVYGCKPYVPVKFSGSVADLLDRSAVSFQDHIQDLLSLMCYTAPFLSQPFYDQRFCGIFCLHVLTFAVRNAILFFPVRMELSYIEQACGPLVVEIMVC